MKSIATSSPFDSQVSSPGEIALLASKLSQDSNAEEGYDGHHREFLLCAEYMLAQKHLIECQIKALRRGSRIT